MNVAKTMLIVQWRAVINLFQLDAYARKLYLCIPFQEREKEITQPEGTS